VDVLLFLKVPREPTETDIKDAAAIASLFGIESTTRFQRAICFQMRYFAWDVIEHARIGWRTREDEFWRDVLSRIASGAAEAAAMCAAARRRELPDLHRRAVDGFLDEIGFEPPKPKLIDETACGVEITQAYQQLADHARAMLHEISPVTRGRKGDPALDLFIFMMVSSSVAERPDMATLAFTEGVATALAVAVLRTREELARRDDLRPSVREATRLRLDAYNALSDGAIRNRIRIALAGIVESQEAPAHAIRAKARN
jgi:hypothetical protein